ncbi:hypothetical protein ACFY2H_40190 [Streptomyces griseofuscus]|uniref:hypothetical protein n=1 Tax=Streptomyces griseofuscus TaxID=146922 RepID=UPI0036AF711F
MEPAIAGAVARQTAAMRALSARAFPETDVPDEQPTSIEAFRGRHRAGPQCPKQPPSGGPVPRRRGGLGTRLAGGRGLVQLLLAE